MRGREDGLPRLLDRRAPLPRRVLALLQPRGPLRRHRGHDRAHAPRLRRAAHAQAVQPPGAHRRVGRRARPHLGRPGRLRHRPLVDARRAGGLRHRSRRDRARAVGRGHRPRRRPAGPTRSRARRQALADAEAQRPPQAAARSRTRRSSAPPAASHGHYEIGKAGHRPVLVHRRRPARGAHRHASRSTARGQADCIEPLGEFRQRAGGHLHHGPLRPDRRGGRRRGRGVLRRGTRTPAPA